MNRTPGGIAAAPPQVAAAAPPIRAESRPGVLWRVLLAIVWPPVLVAAVYAAVGRLGFFPTDEGLTLAYTYRILAGQVPHRDFVTIRPAGSAFMHLLDFAIPGPLFEVSRVITMCEYVAYSVLLAWLVYEIAPWRWSIAMAAVAAAAVLVNLNRFPLMAWYTVDGLLVVAVGLLLVQRGVKRESWPWIIAGFLVLGMSGLTKQSFAPAPAFGWVLLWPWLSRLSWRDRIRDVIFTGAYGAVPGVLYVVAIAALGGFHEMRAELLGSTPLIFGVPLINPWLPGRDFVFLAAGTLLAAVVAAVLASNRGGGRSPIALTAACVMTAAVAVVTLSQRLGLDGDEWGVRLFWMAISFWLVYSALERSVDLAGLVVIGVAWMSSLSFSFFYPNFVAGSLAVYVLHRTWAGTAFPQFAFSRAIPAVTAVVLLAITSAEFDFTRTQDVYLDLSSSHLTATVSDVSPSFGGIRTNPETAAYLQQMERCIKQYPASRVAVLPENAAMYPALGLKNPFPIDWMWPYDVHGSEGRILDTVDRMNQQGDYLVLFQTIDEADIVGSITLAPATADSTIKAFTPLPAQVYARLNGQKSTCGSFLVVYSPPHQ